MSRYVDLAVDVTKLLQFDKIKEISDLANIILANGVNLGYKKKAIQTYEEQSYALKINKINQNKYIDNIQFFDYNLKKEDLLMSIHPTKSYKEMR